MTTLLERLGRFSVRRRRLVASLWVLGTVLVAVLGQVAGGSGSEHFEVPGTEAQRTIDVLEERFPAASGTSAQLVFAVDDGTLAAPGPAATIDAALVDVRRHPAVSSVSELRIAEEGTVGYADVQYDRPAKEIEAAAFARLEAMVDDVAAAGVQLELGGELPTEAVAQEPAGSEMVGLAVAVVVLLVAFGSVIAMGLPIGVALLGLATSMSLISLVAAVWEVPSVASLLAAMIGLGVGIDYALFIVTRHREHLHAGQPVESAVGRAIATSGAAVLFAGMTVVIAILGLAIAGIPQVTALGMMSALTVAVMVAASLTLLPALLGFAGTRIDSLRLPGMRATTGIESHGETMWHRWGRHVSARPWRYLVGSVLLLGVLTLPVAGMRLGMTDNGVAGESLTTRRAYDLLGDGFGPGFNGPLVLAVELAGVDGELEPLREALDADPGVSSVSPASTSPDGSAAVLQVIPTSSPQSAATTDLVHRLRDDVIPAATDLPVHVGGQTAAGTDLSDKIGGRLPWFLAAVIGLSILLLMMVFRSIAVPLKAAVMNLLSIGAAYGAMVAVFQWGWMKDVIGLEQTVPVVPFLPMMMFAILFGLSMDYEVFLLSRVREEYLQRRDNTEAVVEGISATARVITSAALIMISVFGAFSLGDDPVVKMFGLGLAVAVFIDATVIRMVLVPATMRLLGDRNWWLPTWLDRLLPNLDVEGTATPEPTPEPEPDEDRELVGV